MKTKTFSFDEKLHKKCKKELDRKNVRKIILDYNKKDNIKKKYEPEFLSYYYSSILVVLYQFLSELKNKSILEVGYGMPLFLDYLQKQGSFVCGIDAEPLFTNENLFKMSIEHISSKFLHKYKNKFDAIIERITLSKLYDEKFFLKTSKHRFKNKEKILLNLSKLLRPEGILILQDDRGTIFTETQFIKAGFKKIMKETPIIFKNKKGKSLGWNVLAVYQKTTY